MAIELIAEVSTNHGGSVALAKEFIWRFAEAGADWIKFQHTRVKHLRPDDPQYEWFKKAEFSLEQFQELKAECERAGVKYLTTVYNHQDVPEVQQLGLEAIKIGSGEACERPLLYAVTPFRRVFVSGGLGIARSPAYLLQAPQWHIFATVTRYPAPHGLVPARFSWMDTCVGWSDHCLGLESCHVAIMRGAMLIEKHVQLPQQARPPRPFEATVAEWKALLAFADEDSERFLGRWQHAWLAKKGAGGL